MQDRFNRWLDQVEDQVMAPRPTSEKLTQAVFAPRQELTQEVTEGLVAQAHRAVIEQRTAPGPQGEQTLSAHGPQGCTVETLVGLIRLRRQHFYCERCQRGSVPLGAAWEEIDNLVQYL